ncbi:MAG TPA: saccharopine dehydrogenase NADP-binding domain-containing protein [Candidatus Angelobacter sp.]|jgi:short subunit dehydrogenase-like uncharacterized protein|nr:saccharopine dehydrogenase NADP-binding domain-containing protein [Candidatus Angelobacter sp.]
MPERKYDVVLYGASGFTGRQTIQYFAGHLRASELRWAIAGRNPQALEAAKAQAGDDAKSADILIADAHDQQALDRIASQTRIVLSTAGPFALYGNELVDACVRFGAHYVDITGETPWVKDLIDRHHEKAASTGTRIVPCCGFDSVPSDLGAYLIARHMQKNLGTQCQQVNAYFKFAGGVNGGTLATGFNLYESGQAARARDPFLLNPPGEHSPDEIKLNVDSQAATYDPDANAWIAPFIMAVTNERIVRRSAALFEQWQMPYGPGFHYHEFQKFNPGSRFKAKIASRMLVAVESMMKRPLTRRMLKSLVPKPGSGPSEKTMNNGWFRCELVGTSVDGRKVRGTISDQGDPGNRATVKFVCEAALSLALNAGELPGGLQRRGVLTPATAFGDVLAGRLRKAGMKIEIA